MSLHPEGFMGFFLLLQGSKGDPGMTGPTGAAGLPVSSMGSEVLFTYPWPPPETLSELSTQPGPVAQLVRASSRCAKVVGSIPVRAHTRINQ